MQDDRKVGIELPLRILRLALTARTYTSATPIPASLSNIYDVRAHKQTLDQMGILLEALATEAAFVMGLGGGTLFRW